jgi:hypothetical protein
MAGFKEVSMAPDLQHDHNFTKCAQQQIKQYLDSISYDVDVMHEFTDGCSSQYKSRHCLGNLHCYKMKTDPLRSE